MDMHCRTKVLVSAERAYQLKALIHMLSIDIEGKGTELCMTSEMSSGATTARTAIHDKARPAIYLVG